MHACRLWCIVRRELQSSSCGCIGPEPEHEIDALACGFVFDAVEAIELSGGRCPNALVPLPLAFQRNGNVTKHECPVAPIALRHRNFGRRLNFERQGRTERNQQLIAARILVAWLTVVVVEVVDKIERVAAQPLLQERQFAEFCGWSLSHNIAL